MTLLEKFESHRGGLIRLPTQLFWYDGRGWDRTPGRICLLLDAVPITAAAAATEAAAGASTAAAAGASTAACVHLLIDGQPRWVRVAAAEVELL